MNYLDIIITVALFYGLLKGLENGLIKEVTGFFGFFIGIYIAANFSKTIFGGYEQLSPIVSFIILFLTSIICIKILEYFTEKLVKLLALGFFSRLFGGVFGVLKISIILGFLLSVSIESNLINKKTQKKSTFILPFQEKINVILPKIETQKKRLFEKTKTTIEKNFTTE